MRRSHLELRVRLTPKDPPGRANRKARAFELEIVRLRSEGYTCEAIRIALVEIGVDVSLSTVQREAAKHLSRRPAVATKAASLTPAADLSALPTSARSASSALAADGRSGREIAEAFVSSRITNPLIRARSANESSRH
jgi:hypothetical protein